MRLSRRRACASSCRRTASSCRRGQDTLDSGGKRDPRPNQAVHRGNAIARDERAPARRRRGGLPGHPRRDVDFVGRASRPGGANPKKEPSEHQDDAGRPGRRERGAERAPAGDHVPEVLERQSPGHRGWPETVDERAGRQHEVDRGRHPDPVLRGRADASRRRHRPGGECDRSCAKARSDLEPRAVTRGKVGSSVARPCPRRSAAPRRRRLPGPSGASCSAFRSLSVIVPASSRLETQARRAAEQREQLPDDAAPVLALAERGLEELRVADLLDASHRALLLEPMHERLDGRVSGALVFGRNSRGSRGRSRSRASGAARGFGAAAFESGVSRGSRRLWHRLLRCA